MNTYQKVLVCIFRTLGILAMLYSVTIIITILILTRQVAYALGVASAVWMSTGLIFFCGAKSFARIITAGLD